MKQSLELRISQRLTMTPQLQHAIRLLQLSGVELLSEMQEALESNPLLEEKESDESHDSGETEDNVLRNKEKDGNGSTDTADINLNDDRVLATSETEYDKDADIELTSDNPSEMSVAETDWEERYDTPFAPSARVNNDGDSGYELDARNSQPTTLRDHLMWQMRMTPFSPTDQLIAHTIINCIGEDGYLNSTLDEIKQVLDEDQELEMDEIEAVLHQLQNFDPIGVCAQNLGECLSIQLGHLDPEIPWLEKARELVNKHLGLLANRDYTKLKRLLSLNTEDLHEVIKLVRSLHPRPGSTIEASQATYVVPDITVSKHKNKWRADLNPDSFLELKINQKYQSLIRRGDTSTDNRYLQDQLQEARWFIKSLRNRNETVLKVASTIIDRQQAFFEYGEEAMKPLVLHDIAETLGMHESTISRATTQKYMLTPKGIFELKYFFSSHVSTSDGGTCSATAIRSLIKKLIESEPPTKPISDSKIVTLLEQKGIHVARRTVAKYREHMKIPPSNQRKSLL